MTQARSEAYLKCMRNYVRQLGELHPEAPYKPNHHVSLHLPFFFTLFGPCRSWWCFPFERLIGHIQRLSSNHKLGEMESTLLLSFLRESNLRRWLAHPNCPPVFKEIKKVFDKIYAPRGSDLDFVDDDDDDDDKDGELTVKPVLVPSDLCVALKKMPKDKLFLRARARLRGTVYTRSETHEGNSLVLFYPNGNRSQAPVPGCIKYIYSLDGDRYSFAIQRQLPVNNHPDAYACYPHFPAKVYSTKISQLVEIVQGDWIFAHYARWKYCPEYAVVLSLNRVSRILVSVMQNINPWFI
jgi:hypothetical protein